ncbi:hypothetical protein LZZ85_26335 [Terrimonas sp. NA20]|uniref:Uncharacterized protein n=1 Tax=Terrimonas ginsenosidimutans TaxID=2908004 RepID=A0ABS9KZS4_9BACT|nr:hypothetical protein [Terrimonas ginsenosidimutans]MCG2617847.1 hypothetical protein [Terrimonas ginsenosidimutans]
MEPDFETLFKQYFDIEKIKNELHLGLENLKKSDELEEEITVFLKKETNYFTEFAGIKISIFNAYRREPFFFARLNIFDSKTNIVKAWYDLEYSLTFEILDDYFNW